MHRSTWRDPFILVVVVSFVGHGGLGLYAWFRPPLETMPEPLPIQPGRVSIALEAMTAAEPTSKPLDAVVYQPSLPQPIQVEPPPLFPGVPPPQPEMLRFHSPIDLLKPSLKRPDEVSKTEEPKKEEVPKPRLEEEKKPDKGTQNSVASRASEGAEVEQLPQQAGFNPAPPYPAEALAARQEGRVLLRVTVGADGKAAAATVYQSSGVASLDQSALNTVLRSWNFKPALKGNKPVAKDVIIPIRFAIRSTQ